MISVIIPTFNEEKKIAETIYHLRESDTKKLISEILVVDGQSNDNTVRESKNAGADRVLSCDKGRARQMNCGAHYATGKILYFLHADALTPNNFSEEISVALANNCKSGCFRLKFDHNHWFLKANCWFTRFNFNAFRFGDQSLFVLTNTFWQAGGFSEKHLVLEDQEIVGRLQKFGSFAVLQKEVCASARAYRQNGIFKTQAVYLFIYLMYQFGIRQERLLITLTKLISRK